MKKFYKILIVTGIVLVLLLALVFSLVGPIDRRPMDQWPAYAKAMTELRQFKITENPAKGPLEAGWAKANITPTHPGRLAGYGRRFDFESVHDSLYARAMVFDNGASKVAIISVDLIMFPRMVVKALDKRNRLLAHPFDYFYFAATHTHTGYGNWEPSTGGQFLFGRYDSALVEKISNAVFAALVKADREKRPAKIGFGKTSSPKYVANFVDRKNGLVDPFLRVIKVVRDDSSQAIMASYSAHPTNIGDQYKALSRDYPGYLVDTLESRKDIGFAMFLAGMVGSHRTPSDAPRDFKRAKKVADGLATGILGHFENIIIKPDSTLAFGTFEVPLPPSQLRLTKHLKLRDWVFRKLLGPLDANIQLLEIGDILLMGTPCDFSGSLNVKYGFDQLAANHGMHLVITSFNSKYIGYIVDDRFYDTSHSEEVGIMNWTGPGMGGYFAQIIEGLIGKVD